MDQLISGPHAITGANGSTPGYSGNCCAQGMRETVSELEAGRVLRGHWYPLPFFWEAARPSPLIMAPLFPRK
jgi:hypothetical protein